MTGRVDQVAMLPRPFRVERIRRETGDTVTLELDPADGGPPLAFAPGQFNMLYAFAVGEIPISISGDPDRPEPLVHTVRAVGAVSRALCEVEIGDVIGVRGPFGTPWPIDAARGDDALFVAGGIGLAPLRSAFYRALGRRGEYGRVVLIYGARTPDDFLYREQLRHWRGKFDIEVEVTVDHGGPDWHGSVGVVTKLLGRVQFDPDDTTAMICGPEVMMRFAARALDSAGVADHRVYLSMERNMKCAVGLCGHCQLGPEFVCKDGAVFTYSKMEPLMAVPEL